MALGLNKSNISQRCGILNYQKTVHL